MELQASTDESLLVALRRVGLRSVRLTCGIGVCGACTVLVDGSTFSSCLMLAPMAAGREILTVEGVGVDDPVVVAFDRVGAFQCGYCTPGFDLAVRALLAEDPAPSPEGVRRALAGNLCRCGSYRKIAEAVSLATTLSPRGSG
jgi:aerobic-type carbon monoxide dehydrogenase small subunit (CoxS/CutS family)